MTYFRLLPEEIVGEEGDSWRRVPRQRCSSCGRQVVPFRHGFATADDELAIPSLHLDVPPPPLFRVAQIYFATESAIPLVRQAISLAAEAAPVAAVSGTSSTERIYWINPLGRVSAFPRSFALAEACGRCRNRRQVRLDPYPSTPVWQLISDSASGRGLYRVEEQGYPDVADDLFVELVERLRCRHLFSFAPFGPAP